MKSSTFGLGLRIIAMKIEWPRTRFLSDIFAAVLRSLQLTNQFGSKDVGPKACKITVKKKQFSLKSRAILSANFAKNIYQQWNRNISYYSWMTTRFLSHRIENEKVRHNSRILLIETIQTNIWEPDWTSIPFSCRLLYIMLQPVAKVLETLYRILA